MKKLFSEKSNVIFKLFIYQIAMSLLGFFIVSPFLNSSSMCLAASIFAALFYFSLTAYAVVEDGQKDHISVNAGRKEGSAFTGLWYSLVSYLPTIVISVFYSIATLCSPNEILTGLKALINIVIRFFLMGMYLGFDVLLRSENSPQSLKYFSETGLFYVCLLILMPIICGVFYGLSYKGIIHVNTAQKNKK